MSKGPGGYGLRDTAKDIILGTDPTGLGARAPRGGTIPPVSPKVSLPTQQPPQPRYQPPPAPPPVMPVQPMMQPQMMPSRNFNDDINKLSMQMQSFQRHQQDLLNQEQNARRRLEDQLRDANRGPKSPSDGGVSKMDLEDLKRRMAALEAQQDILHLKGQSDRHTSDMMSMISEVKSRPQTDPSKQANTALIDQRVRDLHGQLMGIRQMMEKEVTDRRGEDQIHMTAITRLQHMLQDQNARKNQILQELARKGDMDNAKLSEEAKRLHDKIEYITNEVTRNMVGNEARLKDEMNNKYNMLDQALRNELDGRNKYERDIRGMLDERWRSISQELAAMKEEQGVDRSKNKDKFQKINEALAVLESHLEQGNKKIDRVINAEIQSRKLHEKGLLAKLTDIEDRLATYLSGMNQAIDDAKHGKKTVIPTFDFDGIRREMEMIAADKHKMSMEGILKLEDKMSRVQKGMDRDSKELKSKLTIVADSNTGDVDSDTLARLRAQLRRLDELQEDLEKQHERVRDKVERQIPEDLDELAAKLENSRRQLHDRIDREENERYLAIREMQEEIARLRRNGPTNNNVGPVTNVSNPEMQREIDEVKIAIKKLAESVTTVKNVLDRKITDETRNREKDIAKLGGAADAFKNAGKKK